MAGLKIDRTRATKVAAAFGLVLLAISILPGLLRPPPPPELPADVGFTPAEITGLSTRTPPGLPENPSKTEVSGQSRGGDGGTRRRNSGKKRKGKRGDSDRSGAPGRRRPAGDRKRSPRPPPPADPAPPAPPPAAAAPPVYAPPAYTPPASPPPAAQVPADGSQEFAPK